MKSVILKYSLILASCLIVLNYSRLFPQVTEIISRSASGWLNTLFLVSIIMIGINEYVKSAYKDNSYEFMEAFLVGTLIGLIGSLICNLIWAAFLSYSNYDIDLYQIIVNRTMRFTIISAIAAIIIPLTYKK